MLPFGPLKHFKSDKSNSLDATISKNYDGKAITNIYAHTDRKKYNSKQIFTRYN